MTAWRCWQMASACDMQWSPDGKTLAITTSATDCELSLESIYFIDTGSKAIQQYSIQGGNVQAGVYTVPLGWIRS